MRVLIDSEPVDVPVGQGRRLASLVERVRALAAGRNRVVARMAVEGRPVAAGQLNEALARPCDQIQEVEFVTACPRAMARQTIREVSDLFGESAPLQQGAADKLAAGQTGKALEQLAGCLGLYKAAQEAVSRAVQLNRLDLDQLSLPDGSMGQAIRDLAGQLADIKSALEAGDLVLLGDLLTHELPGITQRWLSILAELDKHLAG